MPSSAMIAILVAIIAVGVIDALHAARTDTRVIGELHDMLRTLDRAAGTIECDLAPTDPVGPRICG